MRFRPCPHRPGGLPERGSDTQVELGGTLGGLVLGRRPVTRRLLATLTIAIAAAISPEAFAHPLTPPRAIHEVAGEWPDGVAHDHDLVVPVVLVVSADGAVEEATIEAGLGEPFDSAALRAARAWRFEPARDENGPVRAKVRAAIRFHGAAPANERSAAPAQEQQEQGEAATTRGVGSDAAPAAEVVPTAEREVVVRGELPPRSASEVRRDRRVLGAAPHQTASDVLLAVPGVFVTQHSGQGKAHQIFFRGFDAAHGQDIELWVAGAPVNEVSNVHGQGYADLHFAMPEVVRAVVARPAAYDPRQGDFAVAGSMEIDLGVEEPGLTVKASVGSFGTRRGFLAYRPAEASERTFAAAELQQTDGFGAARAARRASGLGQAELALGGDTSLTLMASTYAARFGSAGVVRLEDVQSGAIDHFGTYDSDQGGHSSRSQVVATVRRSTRDFDLVLAPFFVRRSLVLRSNYTGYLLDPLLGDSTQQTNESSTIGARASLRRRLTLLSPRDALEAGLLLRSDWVEQAQRRLSSVDDAVTRTEVDATVRATNVGAYLDAELHPIRRVALRGGLRGDALSFTAMDRAAGGSAPNGAVVGATRSAQGTHVGAKGTLDVAVLPGLVATANYGEGFRSPQARSLGDGERTPFTQVSSQEIGLRFRNGARLSAALAGFRTTLSDDLVFDEVTAQNRAVPGTLRLGVVGDVLAQPNDWFTSALGFTVTRATFREAGGPYRAGDRVPFAPEVVVRADLSAQRALGRFAERELVGRLGAGAQYLYRRPLPFGELGSDVMLLDVVASARLRELELTLEVMNLLDREWNDGEFVYASNFRRGATASEIPVRHVTAGAPRSLLLSLTLHL